MTSADTTCWTLIHAAAQGGHREREEFAQQYLGAVRAYLNARWQSKTCRHLIDDAVQDVFVECFDRGGPLTRVASNSNGSFRAYLYGVVRNVARRLENQQATDQRRREEAPHDFDVAADETALSQVFDRAWAKSIMRQARKRHEEVAREAGREAVRRVELLRLRFQEGLAIREIAKRWDAGAAVLHREYSKARNEFRAALAEVVRFHHPGSDNVERDMAALLELLR